ISSANIFHSVDVVDGAMIERGAVIEPVARVERHGFIGALKEGRFVHVVPKAGDAHADEVFVERAPPIAYASQREVWKNTPAGPDDSDKGRAVAIFDEHIVLCTGIIGKVTVAGIFFDVQVGDGDQSK